MQSAALTTIALTGFTVAFFHAAMPTHWLPFVLVARARGWSPAKAMAVLMAAALGHVLITTLLGLLVALLGFQIDEHIGHVFPWIVGGLMMVFGAYYLWRQATGRGIVHHHPPGGHHHAGRDCGHEHDRTHWEDELKDSPLVSRSAGDWTAISGLLVMLTLSPCEAFLFVYLSGVQFGWMGFWLLSLILAAATFGAMMVFTWLALRGFERIRIRLLERNEAGLLGAVFVLLGVIVVAIEH